MTLTPAQKDALATFCEMTRIDDDPIKLPCYKRRDGMCIRDCFWQPDQSRDDCWPIIQRIEELRLWTLFRSTIAVRDWLLNHNGTWAEIYMMMPPSVIVAAVLEIIEKKGGAN